MLKKIEIYFETKIREIINNDENSLINQSFKITKNEKIDLLFSLI